MSKRTENLPIAAAGWLLGGLGWRQAYRLAERGELETQDIGGVKLVSVRWLERHLKRTLSRAEVDAALMVAHIERMENAAARRRARRKLELRA